MSEFGTLRRFVATHRFVAIEGIADIGEALLPVGATRMTRIRTVSACVDLENSHGATTFLLSQPLPFSQDNVMNTIEFGWRATRMERCNTERAPISFHHSQFKDCHCPLDSADAQPAAQPARHERVRPIGVTP